MRTPLPPSTIKGCPRRIVTDRAYLENRRGDIIAAPRLRVRNDNSELALHLDTIIPRAAVGDRLQ